MQRNVSIIFIALLICGAVIMTQQNSEAAQGQQVQGVKTLKTPQQIIVSGRLGTSYLTGQSNEYVYAENGRKLSELQWDLSNVLMLNGGVSVQPVPWLKINGDIWMKVTNGSGDMVDYDWMVEGMDWTDRSISTDVDLNTGYMIDTNAEFSIWDALSTSIKGFVGYKYDNWKWEARGGSYIYSTYSFRDSVGSFPAGEKGITYEQWYHVPYIGLGFSTELTRAFLSGRVIFSPFVSSGDKDQHHMRNLLFEEDFDNGTMVGIDLNGGYHITDQLSLMCSYHYQKYNEVKGETTVTDLTTGQAYHFSGDVAGADHYSHLISLTAQYTF